MFKTALIVSMVVVILLLFFSEFSELEDMNIKEITNEYLDKDVDIAQQDNLKVVVFKDKNISLKKGDYIEVLGTVEEYEGELEIIGDRVRLID